MSQKERKSFNIAITAQKAAIRRNEAKLNKLIEDQKAYLSVDLNSKEIREAFKDIAQLEFDIESSKRPNKAKRERLEKLRKEVDAIFKYDLVKSLDRETKLSELIYKQKKELVFLESLPLDLEKHGFRGWLS